MDFEFSSDALMLRDMLHRFVEDEAKPLEMEYLARGQLDARQRARLRTVIEQMELWGITVPERFGGGGLDMITACLLHEELGKTFLPIDLGDVPPLLYGCQGSQIEEFLTPALAGSRHPHLAAREPDASSPEGWQTTATPEGQAHSLTGVKLLSAHPAAEDFLIVLAKAPAGIGAFLVEPGQDGVTIRENGRIILHLEGSQARPEAVLGECGQALKLGADQVPALGIQQGARYVGLAQRLLDMSIEYARSWTALGALLKERPAIQRMLAEMHVQVESTRWLVYHAAWLADKGAGTHRVAAQVRLATGEMLERATDLATMIYGGPGPAPEVEIHRYVRASIPPDVLASGLEHARAIIAADLLAAGEAR
jgi:acyl-CoA dehydrogenase